MTSRALRLIWRQANVQLRVRTFNLFSLVLFFLQPAIFGSVGMILSRVAGRERPDLIYTVLGAGMLGMWSGLVFTSSFDIQRDRRDGTLELIVASPTSLAVVEAIRTLTNVMAGLVSMAAALVVAMSSYRYSLADANVAGALVSLLMILAGMWSLGVFLANFLVWSRLTTSLVELFEIPVALVCGFMYPISILPGWMQALSAAIPIRWGLETLDGALLGGQSTMFFLKGWGIGLVLSLIYLGLAHWLGGIVQDRIRVTGEMSSI